jgi:hypothetical protein
MPTSERVNRVVLTGGSSGIGLATAQAFLDEGYEVISLSRRDCPLRSPRLQSISVDLADAAATDEAVRAVASRTPATTVVHCAGAIRERQIEDATRADLAELSNLHLGAALSLVQANLPAMKRARFGRIVLISSRAVLGLAKRTAYSATKAGMRRPWNYRKRRGPGSDRRNGNVRGIDSGGEPEDDFGSEASACRTPRHAPRRGARGHVLRGPKGFIRDRTDPVCLRRHVRRRYRLLTRARSQSRRTTTGCDVDRPPSTAMACPLT